MSDVAEQGADDAGGPAWIAPVGLYTGLVLAFALMLPVLTGGPAWLSLDPTQPRLNSMAAVGVLMAVWWITEAAPLAATSLLPILLFPLLGILEPKEVSAVYGDTNIFLYLGGFLVALAIEESRLHERMALTVIRLVGHSPQLLVGGFMLSTGFLSMWLSNTATTLMMLPIAMSVLLEIDELARNLPPEAAAGRAHPRHLGVCMMLGLAYAASIGGMGTLIGTPTNTYIRGFFETRYPQDPLGFGEWMRFATPLAFTMLFCCWVLLVYVMFPLPKMGKIREVVAEEAKRLGPMQPVEWVAAAVFATTAALWIFRKPFDGFGWYLLFPKLPAAQTASMDAVIAVGMAILCFLLPTFRKPGEKLMTWTAAKKIPWDVLLLFGGGLALARGLEATKLDLFLGHHLGNAMLGMNPIAMATATAAGITFFSEVTSNQAAIQMLAPLLATTAEELQINPRCLLIPATIAASCGFMLPVATPPNAIVYGTGRIRMLDMVKAGFCLNWIGVGLVVGFVWMYGLTAPSAENRPARHAATATASTPAGAPTPATTEKAIEAEGSKPASTAAATSAAATTATEPEGTKPAASPAGTK